MSEKDYFSYFNTPEFEALLARYEAMMTYGAEEYFEAEELTDIAEYYAIKEEMKQANEAIDYALKIHPGSTDPLIFKARNQMLDGNLEEAYRIGESIPDQNDREVTFLFAELLLNEGKPEKAKQLMKEKLYVEDDTPKEHFQTTQDIIELFEDYEYYNETIQIAEEEALLAKEQGWRRREQRSCLDLLSYCYINGNHFDKAIDIFNQLLDEDPYDADLWVRLGDIHFRSGEQDKAIDAFDYALAIDPDYKEVYYWKGKCFHVLGNDKEALRYYRTSIEKNFAPQLSNYTCGMLEVNMGLYTDAASHLKKAYTLTGDKMPNSFEILYNLALCNTEIGDLDEARYFYQKAKRLMPNYKGLLKLKARIIPPDEEKSAPPFFFN